MAVDVAEVTDHYNTLADNYDKYYGYWYEPTAHVIARHLDLVPTDKLAEIGSGTGGIAHNLWEIAGLQTPVLAVEPNAAMLQKAKGREGIDTLQATGDEFVAQLAPKSKYNKILFCHSAHHLPNPAATFRALLEAMPQDGRCAVVYYPSEVSLLLWQAAMEAFSSKARDLSKEMSSAGMVVELHEVTVHYKVTKSFWYQRLRGRVYSTIESMTDEQIEEGIAELESTKLSDLGMEEEFETSEIHLIAVGSRPPT